MSTYDAFISYSHAKDEAIAAGLERVLKRLGKRWYRLRALNVFRDDTALSATPQMWPTIASALDRSRYLILLASPESAASQWVQKEVAHWLDTKGSSALLIARTDGDLAWDRAHGDFDWQTATALPKALAKRFQFEPKWVDLNSFRSMPLAALHKSADFKSRAADLAAAVHDKPKADLLSDELASQRAAMRLAIAAAGVISVLGVGVGVAGYQAYTSAQNLRVERENLRIARKVSDLLRDDAARQTRVLTSRIADAVVQTTGVLSQLGQSDRASATNVASSQRLLPKIEGLLTTMIEATQQVSDQDVALARQTVQLVQQTAKLPRSPGPAMSAEDDAAAAEKIYKEIAKDAVQQRAERERIMRDLQTKLFEITGDVTVNKAKAGDAAFKAMDDYIRSDNVDPPARGDDVKVKPQSAARPADGKRAQTGNEGDRASGTMAVDRPTDAAPTYESGNGQPALSAPTQRETVLAGLFSLGSNLEKAEDLDNARKIYASILDYLDASVVKQAADQSAPRTAYRTAVEARLKLIAAR